MSGKINYGEYQDAWNKTQEGKTSPGIIENGTGRTPEAKEGDAIVDGSMSENDAAIAKALLKGERNTLEPD